MMNVAVVGDDDNEGSLTDEDSLASQMVSLQTACWGFPSAYNKQHAVSSIATIEYNKDNQIESYPIIKDATSRKLNDLFKDFETILTRANVIDNEGDIDRSLRVFHGWLTKFLASHQWCSRIKPFFVAFMIDGYLNSFTAEFEGFNDNQVTILQSLVDEANKGGEPRHKNTYFLELSTW